MFKMFAIYSHISDNWSLSKYEINKEQIEGKNVQINEGTNRMSLIYTYIYWPVQTTCASISKRNADLPFACNISNVEIASLFPWSAHWTLLINLVCSVSGFVQSFRDSFILYFYQLLEQFIKFHKWNNSRLVHFISTQCSWQ